MFFYTRKSKITILHNDSDDYTTPYCTNVHVLSRLWVDLESEHQTVVEAAVAGYTFGFSLIKNIRTHYKGAHEKIAFLAELLTKALPPPPVFIYIYILEGVDFRFFWKIDMMGPYLANLGKNNHILEKGKKKKLSNSLLN